MNFAPLILGVVVSIAGAIIPILTAAVRSFARKRRPERELQIRYEDAQGKEHLLIVHDDERQRRVQELLKYIESEAEIPKGEDKPLET